MISANMIVENLDLIQRIIGFDKWQILDKICMFRTHFVVEKRRMHALFN